MNTQKIEAKKEEAIGGVAGVILAALLIFGFLSAQGCAGFKVYAGVERVDQVETKQVTNDESFLCKMGYCDKSGQLQAKDRY